ncbi:hypothetical protein OEZ85_013265 [Tetradesmus obliquus]|uniref:Acetoacetate decarboxylase n=1 Tax=Tetradesmus obliquus TaxID=3088 RepID=A0ABY8U7H8_TETOB|nr:hypothetical protein OEZ85_013265 [Tetradesmus obliquus]
MYLKAVVGAVLLLALASRSLGAVTPASADTDPYVTTPRYNKFPWAFTADYSFAFSVSPAWKQPSNPAGWSGLPVLPGFLPGSPGMLALLRYTESPIGEYSELFYVPGSFVNPFCGEKPLSSIYRIWVDSKYSQRAGRNIWGIPKELATFDWKETNSGMAVTVKDAAGKVFLRLNTTQFPLPDPLTTAATSIARHFVGDCLTTIQWPIDDLTGRSTLAGQVPAYKVAKQCYAAKPPLPIKLDVCFQLKGGVLAKVDAAFMDPVTFTGHKNKLLVAPLGYQLPMNMNATLGQPIAVKCWV